MGHPRAVWFVDVPFVGDLLGIWCCLARGTRVTVPCTLGVWGSTVLSYSSTRDLDMYVGCVVLSGLVCVRVNPPSGSWAGVPTFHQVGLATHRWARGVTGCCV